MSASGGLNRGWPLSVHSGIMPSMSRSNTPWRLTSARVGPSEGDAVLTLYRDEARYRVAAWLWQAAWAGRSCGDALVVTTWTAVEVVAAVGLAAVVGSLAAGGLSAWGAAALTVLLVVLVSRWVRARVAVKMPLWAADGMLTVHRRRASTDRGTGGALTERAWRALCSGLVSRNGRTVPALPHVTTAVLDWATVRDRVDHAPGPATDADVREVARRTVLVESLVS